MERHPKILVPATVRPIPKSHELEEHREAHALDTAQQGPVSRLSTTGNHDAHTGTEDASALVAPQIEEMASETGADENGGEDKSVGHPRQLKSPEFQISSNPAQHAAGSSAVVGDASEADTTAILQQMGEVIGADFSSVTIHVNSARATALGALAFCEGESLYFAPGQYNPGSPMGLQLIGHELAHVVQQRNGRVRPTTARDGTAINDDLDLEAEADRMGLHAAHGIARATPAPAPPAMRAATTVPTHDVVQMAAVAQLTGDYAHFPDALTQVLAIHDGTPDRSSPHHPSHFETVVPADCYTVLWDIYKALLGGETDGHTASEWAASAIDGMHALEPALTAHEILPGPLTQRVVTALTSILNPMSGSAAASSMDAVFATCVEPYLIEAPERDIPEATANRYKDHYTALRATMVAAANILARELRADVPAQILNADSPYNYLHYEDAEGISGSNFNGIKALYAARWEVSTTSRRDSKIHYAEDAFRPILSERQMRSMLDNLTSLDEAGIATQLAAIQAGIQQYVRNRMAALLAEPEVHAPIARNGAAIPARAVRRPRGSRSGPADPIVYAEGATVTPWELTEATTNLTAFADLGENPTRTFLGQNIGAYNGSTYPYVYNTRLYDLVVHDGENDNMFGMKYGGNSSMTSETIESLLATDYFTEAQKVLIRGSVPQIRSEGGISSINTYDNQYLTVAGRGEKFHRISLLIDAAHTLTAQYEPENVASIADLSIVQELVDYLGTASTLGTPGDHCRRFDMEKIHQLIGLLEQPAIHRAMTFAKLNDSIVGFFGGSYAHGDHATRYDQDLNAGLVASLEREIDEHHLEEVIIGIAMHHRLGYTAYEPMSSAIDANNAHPQASIYVANGQPDFRQLSKQVAYLTKVRLQLMVNDVGRGEYAPSSRVLRAITNQKAADFQTYFEESGIAATGSGYFDYASATAVLPFWTAHNTFTGSATAPPAGNLYFIRGEGRSKQYFDCGPALGGVVSSPTSDTAGAEASTPEGEETVE
jgi:hypothetical protein